MVNVLSSRTGYTLSLGADGFTLFTFPRCKDELTFTGTNSCAFFTTEVTLRTEASLVLRLWWYKALFVTFASLHITLSLWGVVEMDGAVLPLVDMWDGTENISAAHYVAPDRSTLMIAGRTGVCRVALSSSLLTLSWWLTFFLLFAPSPSSEDKSIQILLQGRWEVIVGEEEGEREERVKTMFLWRELLFLFITFLLLVMLLLLSVLLSVIVFYNSNGELLPFCWDALCGTPFALADVFIFLQVASLAESIMCGVLTRSSFALGKVITLLGLTTVGVQFIAASFASRAYRCCYYCCNYY